MLSTIDNSAAGMNWKTIQLWVFPSCCLFCHQPLSAIDDACCGDCLPHITPWSQHHCQRCGRVLPEALAGGPCGACLQHPPAYLSSFSIYQYKGAVRDALLQWKRAGDDAAIRWLWHTAISAMPDVIDADDLLLPIPMPLSRMQRSGLHHTADCCRWLAGKYGCDWQWRLLRRQGNQARQSTLKAHQRKKNMHAAFTIDPTYLPTVKGYRRIWLVDDIITTGATMHHAALCLKKHGLSSHAWSLAHTPMRD